MLLLHRRAHDPRTSARCAVHDLLHSAFRVRVVETGDVTLDEALTHPATGWNGDGVRLQIVVLLHGHVRLREQGVTRWLGAGQFAIGSSLDAVETRFEPSTLALNVDYRLGSLGTRAVSGLPSGALGASARARLFALGQDLASGDDRAPAAADVAHLLAVLRGEGLPLDAHAAADLAEPILRHERAVARALTSTLSRLDDNPMAVDLGALLGVSRRSVIGLIARVGARFDLGDSSFRALRNRWRLIAGVALASHARARTEDVARAVGYRSARAFCHAFLEAGLPSPGNVRRALAALT